MIVVDEEMNVVEAVEQEEQQQNTNIHPQIVMTEAKLKLQGPRQLILIRKQLVSISKMVTALLKSVPSK